MTAPPTAIVAVPAAELAPAAPSLTARAMRYVRASRAEGTMRKYERDVAHWLAWLDGRAPSPALVAEYLMDLAEGSCANDPPEKRRKRAVPTVNRKLCAISRGYVLAAAALDNAADAPPDPTKHALVRLVWDGIRREHGRPPARKAALTTEQLRAMVGACDPATLEGLRDRCLLLLGFFSAQRRANVVGFRVEHLRRVPHGFMVLVPKSKSDQYSAGRDVPVPRHNDPELCPVRATDAWLAASGITTGPVIRGLRRGGTLPRARGMNDRTVAKRVQEIAARVGVPVETVAGHSLRSGFVTEARKAGASVESIQEVTGHASYDMLRRYIREADVWRDAAGARIGRAP